MGFPAAVGMSSENSAHRIAVEWEDDDGKGHEGVFVPRRDTDSRMNALAGGRLFPGVHHLSEFRVTDQGGRISLQVLAKDFRETLVDLEASETNEFPQDSAFASLDASSTFFEAGCTGYSSRPDSSKVDGLRLKGSNWRVSPLAIRRLASAYYDDESVFPAGSIHFDHALVMRDIPHEWHSEPTMSAEPQASDSKATSARPQF